ncbi:ABC transporter ATP-binding protein [Levilactobacillus suantsaiihabitans]|uniref:ABC transporter ATP-binding protein n=1 Tax=Levilactobacillus suantsaiihabitans TaxID=2487722 RepID=A0A4Z0JD60_9LACO|nr:ATP-binding cassette domain-containing protein [Levilactobacillus suantsaiihabitans]TGD20372.1 ABC transporter ATP-binding protein [Levilactobacillus suantsaiihabitans]
MRELIKSTHLTFTYAGQTVPTLTDISLDIHPGDFVTVVGATGSGKTTLLKQLKTELKPAGIQQGQVTYQGTPVADLTGDVSAQQLGYVAQDPQVQPIMATVIEELAFPLENLGYATAAMNGRIAEVANFLGLNSLLHTPVQDLSGGQLQLVNLASVLALKPQVILLDEPTAQLDPTTAQNFLNILQQVHDELAITIILTEHRLSRVLALANRLVLLEHGRLAYDGPVSAGLVRMHAEPTLRPFVPPVPAFFLAHHLPVAELPLTVTTGRQVIAQQAWRFAAVPSPQPQPSPPSSDFSLTAKGVSLRYPTTGDILHQVDLDVTPGSWLAIIGKNGSGKSTLLSVLAGLRKPQHGKVKLDQQVVWKMKNHDRLQRLSFLSQNPTEQFSGETVTEELTAQAKLAGVDATERVPQLLTELQLTAVADHNTFDLSGGQQQLVGLALALITQPQVLLLDEPTKGLDPATKQLVGRFLQRFHEDGLTIIMASHDMDFCAAFADTCTFMFDGRLNQPQPTRQFFTDNFLSTTAINRLLRQQVPTALFSRDVTQVAMKGGEKDRTA